MSIQTFELPDLGEGLTEAEVVRWLVAVGDVVQVDQVVVEVETAKSIVEVPSPYAGLVTELHGAAGETVDVGRPLISLTGRTTDEESAGSGNVLIGYGTSTVGESPRRRRRPRSQPESADSAPPVAQIAAPTSSGAMVAHVASPLVRRIARDAGLSLPNIRGTGQGGLITRQDVLAAIANTIEPTPMLGGRTGLPEAKREQMSGFRKAVSVALSRSRTEIPDATVWVDVDFTALVGLRAAAKVSGRSVPGLLAYLGRFVVAGLKEFPELNGEVDSERGEVVQYDGVNLGIAIQTDRGLVVPAIRNAHLLTTTQLDEALSSLVDATRAGRTTQTELTSGTFTLNNYGPFNVDGSAAIINHPQVAILGFGRILDRAWVVDGDIISRKIAQMSLVFDHRVCDGGTAAGFMRLVADAIESPLTALAHL